MKKEVIICINYSDFDMCWELFHRNYTKESVNELTSEIRELRREF